MPTKFQFESCISKLFDASPSLSDNPVSPFGFFSKKEWSESAKKELDGADPFEKLSQHIDDIEIPPYFDDSDLPSSDFNLPASKNEFLGARAWRNLPLIRVNHAKEANEQALMALQSGADGILFDLEMQEGLDGLLEKIEMPHCSTAFLTDGRHSDFFSRLIAISQARKYDPSTLSGAIFWETSPVQAVKLVEQFAKWNQFHPLGLVAEKPNSPAKEVAQLIAKAVIQLDNFESRPDLLAPALNAIAFSLGVGNDFFLEIAKLKALRILWQQVAKAYSPHHEAPAFLHIRTMPWENQGYQPHGNMIRNTTLAMSAVLGGCDALTVEPDDEGATRVARNVSSILREESHFEKVADPTAGSYYLSWLTDRIANEAWKKFQDLIQ